MKRSRVNRIMAEADAMIRRHGFTLPPFAYWSVEDFRARKDMAARVTAARMGWDITDYGQRRFDQMGLFLFTLRNGDLADLRRGGGMCYAEKLLISRQDQLSPMHTHAIKAEDIINRGGATLVVELYGSDDRGGFAPDRGGVVRCDGIARPFGPGEKLRLAPGGKRHADARGLACLLGRGGRCADRRGLDRERRPDRQYLPRTDRALCRNRGG